MSDVKRYEPFGRDGLSSVMHEDSVGDYVRYDDHEDKRKGWIEQHARDSKELRELCQARDEARKERDQLRAEVQRLRSYEAEWEHVLNELRAELDQYKADPSYEAACATIRALRAEIAAIRGQEPVAWMDEDGALHTTTESAHFRGAPVTPLYALPPQQPDAVSVPREFQPLKRFDVELSDNRCDCGGARSLQETECKDGEWVRAADYEEAMKDSVPKKTCDLVIAPRDLLEHIEHLMYQWYEGHGATSPKAILELRALLSTRQAEEGE